MPSVTVKSRSKSIKTFEIGSFDGSSPLSSLAEKTASTTSLDINRLRLTVLQESSDAKSRSKHVNVDLTKTAKENGLTGDSITLYVKDLGPQISWRAVYVLEYLGPLMIHPILYFYYGSISQHSVTQTLSFVLVMLHFIKREYETLFVHKFSLSTMPIFNLYKNSSYYWFISGLNLALFIYSPNALPNVVTDSKFEKFFYHTSNHSEETLNILVGFWVYAEISNFITHLNLSRLRSNGSTERKIPMGYGFSLVSFPNYFFESLSWLIFAVINNNPMSYLFFAIGSIQMMVWAAKKHKRYLKEFGDKYPKNRKIYVPFIY